MYLPPIKKITKYLQQITLIFIHSRIKRNDGQYIIFVHIILFNFLYVINLLSNI